GQKDMKPLRDALSGNSDPGCGAACVGARCGRHPARTSCAWTVHSAALSASPVKWSALKFPLRADWMLKGHA
ncbi:MAG: hypothetical protein OEW22_01095, partial [Rubrivivax sp.]|nr:hypothetical protein [Rubrivivax sp.]